MRLRRTAVAVAATVAGSIAVTGLGTLPAHAAIRFEAENGTAGPSCGDNGQVPSPHGTASGSTVVFFGGDGCYVSFNLSSSDVASGVRWYGGGVAGSICGTFEVRAGGTERARSNRSCSTGGSVDDFQVATFPSNSLPSGTVQLVWHPESSWHDAHVDWFETTGPTQVAPGNDHFGFGYTIPSGLPFSTSQSTANATLQSGEPRPCGSTAGTVWYWWTPSSTRLVQADTIGSGYDTVLAVYTGSSLSALTNVACNDDASGTQSIVQFTAQAGVTYRIQLGGYNGQTGTAVLRLSGGATVPGLPSGLSVSAPGAGQLRVSWNAASDGGSAITEYRVWGSSSCGTTKSYLGSVSGADRSFTDSGLEPGLRCYAVSAVNGVGEGGRSSEATGRAYAQYRVELRAFIPHWKVVDPVLPGNPDAGEDGTGYAYAHYVSGGSCNRTATTLSTVWGWFEGDSHVGFDGTYRVRSMLDFRWDGAALQSVAVPGEPRHGVTRRFRHYREGVLRETCELASGTANDSPNAYAINGTSFRLDYHSENPLTPAWATPAIDGWVEGSFSGNTLNLRFTTDEFPSHALRVTRNGVTQLTHHATDASCLSEAQVRNSGSRERLLVALNSSQAEATKTVPPTMANQSSTTPSETC